MAGQVRRMLDRIMKERAKGSTTLEMTTRTKLILKGLDPARFDAASPDDASTIARVREVAKDLGIAL